MYIGCRFGCSTLRGRSNGFVYQERHAVGQGCLGEVPKRCRKCPKNGSKCPKPWTFTNILPRSGTISGALAESRTILEWGCSTPNRPISRTFPTLQNAPTLGHTWPHTSKTEQSRTLSVSPHFKAPKNIYRACM